MSIARASLRRPVAVGVVALGAIFLGGISFTRLPIDLLPDIAYPRLVVYTAYPDVGPVEVERALTERIEQAVSTVPRLERVESVSREGVSLVSLRFAWGTDMDFAALNVREKLDNIRESLPELADAPVVLRTDPNAEPIMALSVTGPQDLASLKALAEAVFKRRLEQLDGVAEAASVGGLDREIQVDVNPGMLESHGLPIETITNSLAAANQSAPGGTIRKGRYRYSLRTMGELLSVAEIRAVPLLGGAASAANRRGILTVGDVATVTDGFRERESIARYNGQDAVGLLVFKNAGANTVRVAERVEEVLMQLRTEYPDVGLHVASSQAGFVSEAIDSVVQNLVQGAALAFLILFLFLRNPRYPIAIALAIPISVVVTFSLLDATGVSLNVMSLGGLALGVGMLVDNSIVVLENIFRHREMGANAEEAAVRGTDEVIGAITGSTLTTIAVFGPIIYVQGVAGQLFRALSFAVAFSLLASILVAVTVLPVLAVRWGGKGPVASTARSRWLGPIGPLLDAFERQFDRFGVWYERVLASAMAHRGRVVGIALVLFVLGIALGLRLDRSVLPDVDQGQFRASLELPRGTPLEETARVADRLDSIIRADSAVDAVFSRVGRRQAVAGLDEDDPGGVNTASLDVRLKGGRGTPSALARLRPPLSAFPSGSVTFETGQATALGRLLGGSEADLAVRIRGEDLDAAFTYARAVEVRLRSVPALTNARLAAEAGQPEIQIEIDRERAAVYGIEPSAVAEVIRRNMQGESATDFHQFDQKIPVMVRLPEADRRSLETLNTLTVSGVSLRQLVTTRETVGPAEVRRVDQTRTIAVFADVARGGIEDGVGAIRDALRELPPPPGLRTEIGGENEEMRRSFQALAFAFLLAVFLIYMIQAAEFESLIHPLSVMLSVPLAVVGASVALWVTGAGLNTLSLIGIVILVGIVDNDAIILVAFINQMRAEGKSIRQAIAEAGRTRLRPIVMTTLTTLVGVVPMAIGFGSAAEVRAPLAIAVLGGLFSSTALTLVVVPVAYDLVEEGRARAGAFFRGEITTAKTGTVAEAAKGGD